MIYVSPRWSDCRIGEWEDTSAPERAELTINASLCVLYLTVTNATPVSCGVQCMFWRSQFQAQCYGSSACPDMPTVSIFGTQCCSNPLTDHPPRYHSGNPNGQCEPDTVYETISIIQLPPHSGSSCFQAGNDCLLLMPTHLPAPASLHQPSLCYNATGPESCISWPFFFHNSCLHLFRRQMQMLRYIVISLY